MSKVNEMLEEAIVRAFDTLDDMPLGSEDHDKALQELKALYMLKIDDDKNEIKQASDWEKMNDEKEKSDRELELRQEELKLDRERAKHEKVRMGLQAGLLVGGLVGTMWFEANGHILPRQIRDFAQKIRFW